MSHFRTALRQAATDALTAAGLTAYNARTDSVDDSSMPCCLVMATGEVVENATLGRNPIQKRTTDLHVMLFASVGTDTFDALDALCARVEAALLAPGALAPAAKEVVLRATLLNADAPAGGLTALATADIVFEASTMTRAGMPAVTV